jgi:hypothetical protein
VPVDLLARLEFDLALAELKRGLGERRPLCWVLAPALHDELPERFALLRERQPPIQECDVLDDLVIIEVLEQNFARQHLPEQSCVEIDADLCAVQFALKNLQRGAIRSFNAAAERLPALRPKSLTCALLWLSSRLVSVLRSRCTMSCW